jgi:hypothetical protein
MTVPHVRFALIAVLMVSAFMLSVQTQEQYTIKPLPPGGPTPRLADGHPDLTGQWFPNGAGQGVSGRFGVDPLAIRTFDPKVTPRSRRSSGPRRSPRSNR